ncbi:MFS general substrate transporter [Apiospora marii]|uniref:MFS general substrate transporter n=1 Tax=Apiospora marii TaxID=335849 RepID=A0ABR1R9G2_9PEZI
MGLPSLDWLFGRRSSSFPAQPSESSPLLTDDSANEHGVVADGTGATADQPQLRYPTPNDDDGGHRATTIAIATGSAEAMAAHASLQDDEGSSYALKLAAAMYCFAVLGMFVSTTGVILSSVKADYGGLSDPQVSLLFLAAPAGYLVAAQLNRRLHLRYGRRGIAVVGPSLHVAMAAVVALHPPFPVVLSAWVVGSLGHGVVDGSVCAWAGDLESASAASGMLHGAYSAGAGLGPFLAGTLISREGQGRWYEWFYVLGAASILELLIMTFAFRADDAKSYRKHINNVIAPLLSESDPSARTSTRYKSVVGICASFLLVYVGTEALITGWIVAYMERVRHMSLYAASLCSTAFGLGMAIGRLVLGLVTEKFGVRRAVPVYVVGAVVLDVLFALSPMSESSTTPAVVLVSLIGFCLGPLFPSAIVLLVQLLPRYLHVRAVSVVALVG